MKRKDFALMGIAVVLCSMLLVALPVISADQTTQKASASAGIVTTASEDDFVLGIYGNANEDDTIDMRDVTYTKLVIFGKKPETELADAYYDDEVDVLDVVQIKLIILGRESELTIVQYLGFPKEGITEEPVTINMPIEKIVTAFSHSAKTLCAFGAQDRIVGVSEYGKKKGELKTFLDDKPSVGTYNNPDMEKIMELKPDFVLHYSYKSWPDIEEPLNAAGIPVVQMDFFHPEKYSGEIRNLGWILDKKERAEELINFEQQHLDLIEGRVKDLENEQKPRVYFETYRDYLAIGSGNSNHDTLVAGGGINIFDDIEGYMEIDPEKVIVRNPQVILRAQGFPAGYEVTDTGPMEELRNAIMCRPGWDHVDAVENGKVYLISQDTKSTHSSVYTSYIAKWLHPELFEDIDPMAIHEEWFERFLGIEYQGVYAYPIYPV